MSEHLVSDAEAERIAGLTWADVVTVHRLLVTRDALVDFAEAARRHAKETHYLTCPWCRQIVEKGDALLSKLHGKAEAG
jgi:hypothetical protein